MHRTSHARWGMLGIAALVGSLLTLPAAAASAAPAVPAPTVLAPAATTNLATWGHDDTIATTGPVADGQVRRSSFYEASVATVADPSTAYSSFVYMSVPRSGNGKVGYDEQDGAEFSADADLTMSWSSFEYSTDVWVDVSLTTGETISSVDEVTIRPTDLGLEKELVDSSTVRVKVPFSADGLRFSVEFAPQLFTTYNDLSGASGALTTESTGNRAVHTEPQNSMMVFANPTRTGADAERLIPTEASGTIYRPAQGLVNDLDDVTADIVYFEPGTYYMGSDYHAQLPANVRWVYLAPGAYVKGAFRFVHDTQTDYRVTGLGVLSGEQYVYEPDTRIGYQHSTFDNCHAECVKMLQFESSNTGQSLDLEGVTIASPPYHSFVVYAHEGSGDDRVEVGVEDFRMTVQNYKQVGSWYWQTDGIELYDGGRMSNTFFHANDDVLKMYHSDVHIENTVIWKNENGPVIQWGWVPRDIDDVSVTNTDIIHNRMYWKDAKYNTCVFNSSSHWEDMGATDLADVATTVKNMTFTDTRVEGMLNCGIRVFALSNTENITIDGFQVDAWNDLDASSQASLLKRYTDTSGTKVTIADETTDHNGLLLHDYAVGGVPILKAGDNWASDELGRLNFDADTWDSWDATSDDAPTGAAPALTVDGLVDGSVVPTREIVVRGTTDAPAVTVTVNGVATAATVDDGSFSARVFLTDITNRVVVVATGRNGVQTVERRTLTALGTLLGSVEDPVGDDNGPGTYTYPTDGAFNPGSFDLTGLDVYRDRDLVRFVVATDGEIHNPWGGSGMSTQRVNIYLRDGSSTAVTPMLPGTNTSTEGAWTHAIVADGRYADAAFGGGVYDADHRRVGAVTLDVDPSGSIIATVPAAVFAGSDLAATGYQVAMFSDAEDGEGVGNVRPVYSAECAQGVDCPDFVGPYRGGGGAGSFTDQDPSRDTDTSDSNAFDLFTGATSQAEVMDWTRGPVIAPYVVLERANDPDPGTDPGTVPTIAIAGGTVAAGGKVTVTGAGFAPTESLQVTLHSDPVDLAVAASDASGAFSTVVTVPRDTPPGAHRIEVRGAASGSAWANLTVTAATGAGAAGAAPSENLAATGSDVPIPLLTALALLTLIVGAALRHARSRAERHRL